MLAAIVNAMLERIERLMNEVKGVCDNIAHDLRTPLTRLRAQLYRMQQQAGEGSAEAAQLDSVLSEAGHPMARLSRPAVLELEDRQRRSGFVQLDPVSLLQELHEFYLPLAEDDGLVFQLHVPGALPSLKGDRALLFEAIANLLSNSIKLTPPGGAVILRGVNQAGIPASKCSIPVPESRRPNARRCSSASIAPRQVIRKRFRPGPVDRRGDCQPARLYAGVDRVSSKAGDRLPPELDYPDLRIKHKKPVGAALPAKEAVAALCCRSDSRRQAGPYRSRLGR